MKRSWLAGTLVSIGLAAMLLIWFGFGGDRAGHAHGSAASAVIAGAGATEPGGSANPASADPVPSAPVGGVPSPGAVDEHAAHAAAAGAATSAAEPAAAASSTPDDPDAPAPDRRQISLAEAAGGDPTPVTAAPVVDRWLDADAAGVNEGTKQQAADVILAPAPRVDPTEVLPAHGLTNGCVAGYGRGTACLPQTPPSHAGHGGNEDLSVYWTCAEARTLLPDGIVVDNPAADPLGLDSNNDGTACGPGDR